MTFSQSVVFSAVTATTWPVRRLISFWNISRCSKSLACSTTFSFAACNSSVNSRASCSAALTLSPRSWFSRLMLAMRSSSAALSVCDATMTFVSRPTSPVMSSRCFRSEACMLFRSTISASKTSFSALMASAPLVIRVCSCSAAANLSCIWQITPSKEATWSWSISFSRSASTTFSVRRRTSPRIASRWLSKTSLSLAASATSFSNSRVRLTTSASIRSATAFESAGCDAVCSCICVLNCSISSSSVTCSYDSFKVAIWLLS
mmetsp:Transcript_106005/g.265482  ORF Transcript_106005/g.265482 Transcript_106005/m.265482 type:complete len:262 (-) Transcript_106005:225-1010(-)